jgi:hypothetical protein
MSDPRPLAILLGAQLLGGVLGLGWWYQLSPTVRTQRLTTIAHQEQAQTWPPRLFLEQARWLGTHRLARLQSLVGISALGLLIGLSEGLARRQRDPFAGVRLRSWTLGLLGMALLPGIVGALVLCPAPWPLPWIGSGIVLWVAGISLLILQGRPNVP